MIPFQKKTLVGIKSIHVVHNGTFIVVLVSLFSWWIVDYKFRIYRRIYVVFFKYHLNLLDLGDVNRIGKLLNSSYDADIEWSFHDMEKLCPLSIKLVFSESLN